MRFFPCFSVAQRIHEFARLPAPIRTRFVFKPLKEPPFGAVPIPLSTRFLDERNETIRGELGAIKDALYSGQAAINNSLSTIHRRIDDLLRK